MSSDSERVLRDSFHRSLGFILRYCPRFLACDFNRIPFTLKRIDITPEPCVVHFPAIQLRPNRVHLHDAITVLVESLRRVDLTHFGQAKHRLGGKAMPEVLVVEPELLRLKHVLQHQRCFDHLPRRINFLLRSRFLELFSQFRVQRFTKQRRDVKRTSLTHVFPCFSVNPLELRQRSFALILVLDLIRFPIQLTIVILDIRDSLTNNRRSFTCNSLGCFFVLGSSKLLDLIRLLHGLPRNHRRTHKLLDPEQRRRVEHFGEEVFAGKRIVPFSCLDQTDSGFVQHTRDVDKALTRHCAKHAIASFLRDKLFNDSVALCRKYFLTTFDPQSFQTRNLRRTA